MALPYRILSPSDATPALTQFLTPEQVWEAQLAGAGPSGLAEQR